MATDPSKSLKSKPTASKASAKAKAFPEAAARPHTAASPFSGSFAPNGLPPFAPPYGPGGMAPQMPFPPGAGMMPPGGAMMSPSMPMSGNASTTENLFANLGNMLRLGVDALNAALVGGNQLLQGMTGGQQYGYGPYPHYPHTGAHGHMRGHHCCGHYQGDHYHDSCCRSCCDVYGRHCCNPSVHNCC